MPRKLTCSGLSIVLSKFILGVILNTCMDGWMDNVGIRLIYMQTCPLANDMNQHP